MFETDRFQLTKSDITFFSMSKNRQYHAVFLHLQYEHLLIKKDVDTCLEASQQNNRATLLNGLIIIRGLLIYPQLRIVCIHVIVAVLH